MDSSNKKTQLNSILYYFFFYVPFGAVCPLLSQYLSSIGLSGTEVGAITACSTLGASIGGVILGKIYSNTKKKRIALMIIAFTCAILMFSCKFAVIFISFLFMYMVLYFFQEPLHSLSDATITQNGENFPLIRSFGAIGYAIASFVTGVFCESRGLDKIFYIGSISYLISIIFISRLKEPKNFVESKKDKVKVSVLLKEKRFIKLLICSMFFMGIMLSNNTYFGYLYRDGGGSLSGIGLAFLLMAGSESVVMAFIPKLEKKLSIEKIIVAGVICEIFRFLIYSFNPSYIVLLSTFFLQGIMDGILLVEFVKYFTKVVEPKYATLSVAIFNALGVNLSTISANLIGGVVLDKFSSGIVYLVFSFIAIIGLSLYFIFGLQKENN